jgi:hypothetical protein
MHDLNQISNTFQNPLLWNHPGSEKQLLVSMGGIFWCDVICPSCDLEVAYPIPMSCRHSIYLGIY